MNPSTKNYDPKGPVDKNNMDDPRNFPTKNSQMLNKMNDPETGLKAGQSAQNDAIATRMAKDTASSFGKSPPKSIPYMPPYKRINQQSISGPVTKANEENTMSLIHDKKTMSVADAVSKIMEAEKMAKKDHDQDGKIESGKDEYLGSRIRAAKAAGKLKEELKGNQHKIDANKNGKVDAHDFKLLRGKKTMKEEEQIDEGGMPSSVIKHKQSLATKSPEELHAGFKEVAKRMGKSIEHVARSTAWSHGYGKGQGQGSSHYYDKIKHLGESFELDEAFPTVADGEKSLRAKEGKTSSGTLTKTKTGLVHTRDYEDDSDETPAKKGRPTGGGAGKSTKKKKLTEMIAAYKERGIDSLYEEPDNATFTKELEDQKAKFDGKKKGGDVAKPSVQAVKVEQYEEDDGPLSEEQLDELSKATVKSYVMKKMDKMSDEPVSKNQYGYAKKDVKGMTNAYNRLKGYKPTSEEVELEERTLTADEKSNKEDYVKGMKKKLSGFKERYGDRAKEVMYATATKMAKKD